MGSINCSFANRTGCLQYLLQMLYQNTEPACHHKHTLEEVNIVIFVHYCFCNSAGVTHMYNHQVHVVDLWFRFN